MKVKIKDRRMKQREVEMDLGTNIDISTFWGEDSIWVVKIEPIYGGIFGDI
jgi:hypothetical protein